MLIDDITNAIQAAFADQTGLNTLEQDLKLISVEATQTQNGIRISGVYESKVNKVLTRPRMVGSKLRKTKTGTIRVSGYTLPPPSFDTQIEAVEQDESMATSIPPAVTEFISNQLGQLGKYLKTISL